MQSQTNPPVLPVAPVAFIIGGTPNTATRIGPYMFPHSVSRVAPVFFSAAPAASREAKEKCKEKLKLKEHIEKPVPDAPVLKPARRGRKPKYPDENDQMQNKNEIVAPPSSPKGKKKLVVELVPISMHSWQLPNGGVKVRDYKLEPHQFRIMIDINWRHWLVYVRYSLQTEPNLRAYELLFVGKFHQGMRARYVGNIDAPLSDGRVLFHPVQSLHDLDLENNAWWILNKCRIPIIGKQPGPGENPYLPYHVVKDEHGAETQYAAPFEPNDFVTFLFGGQEIQAYVLRRHDPVCAPAARLYVLLCVKSHEFTVFTVYDKDICPPRIQDVVRPKPGELWWVKEQEACHRNAYLKLQLEFCLPPRDGFKRGHLVSVPNRGSPTERVCACISATWIFDGRMCYKVKYPKNLGNVYDGFETVFHTQDLLGPSASWKLSDFEFDLTDEEKPAMSSNSQPRNSGEKRARPASLSPPPMMLEPAVNLQATPHKVRRISLVQEGGAQAPVLNFTSIVFTPPPLVNDEESMALDDFPVPNNDPPQHVQDNPVPNDDPPLFVQDDTQDDPQTSGNAILVDRFDPDSFFAFS